MTHEQAMRLTQALFAGQWYEQAGFYTNHEFLHALAVAFPNRPNESDLEIYTVGVPDPYSKSARQARQCLGEIFQEYGRALAALAAQEPAG